MRTPRRALVLLVAGWALLLTAWAVGNPPFASPDEEAHHLRALGVAEGRLLGDPAVAPPESGLPPALLARRARWLTASTRSLEVPGALVPAADCYLSDPRASAACTDRAAERPAPQGRVRAVVLTGTYHPLPYLLPGAVVEAADGPRAANRLGRAVTALPVLALLAAAAWALAGAGAGVALLGLLAAVTPMALFTGASLTGSGLEVASALAFAAALVAVVRGGASRGTWVLVGVAGAVLALSRTTGPAWAVLILLLVPAVLGGARHLRGGRPALLAGATVVAAVVLNQLWEAAYSPEATVSLADARVALRTGVDQLVVAAPELVGTFGYLEFDLPGWVPGAWALVVAGLLAGALRAASLRGRLALAATIAGVGVVLPVLLYAAVIRHTGFGLQGRYVLPVIAVLPLLAGALASRRAVGAHWLVAAGALLAAAQLGAWWANARRSAVGIDGPWWFLGAAEWAPPGGWVPWVLVAVSGAALLVAAIAVLASTAWRAPSQTPSSSAG